MLKKILFIFLFVVIINALQATPVIINDTGDWSGEIQAAEEGFLVYVAGMWTQNGVNYNAGETIETFLDDFSPVITNSGDNTVTCTYSGIGWIWPYGGPTVDATIAFKTAKLVVEPTQLIPYGINSIDTYNAFSGEDPSNFPSNGVIVVDDTVTIQNTFWADISSSYSFIGTGFSLTSMVSYFATKFSLTTAAASLVATAISEVVDAFTIKTIKYCENYAPATRPTNPWNFTIVTQGDLYHAKTKIYDGGTNGYAATGETTFKTETFYRNIEQIVEYQELTP